MGVKQSIPSNSTSTSSKTFGQFKGVDFSSSPFEVSDNRATYCENLINEDGTNHKRKGWRALYPFVFAGFLPNIKTVFSVNFDNKKYSNVIIVYKEQLSKPLITICLISDDPSIIPDEDRNEEIYENVKKSASFESEDFDNCYCFMKDNKAYIKTPSCFVVVDKESIKKVSDVAYVPTTTISINRDSEETATRATKEEVNLLSLYRKNKLLGLNLDNEYCTLTISPYYGYTIEDVSLVNENGAETINTTGIFLVKAGTYTYVINAKLGTSTETKSGRITVTKSDVFKGTLNVIIRIDDGTTTV